MKAYLSRRAARTAERIDGYWRSHGDDSSIFARELLAAVEQLESGTSTGASYATARRPHLRRVLLPKSRVHLYFEIDDVKQIIQIFQIWDGRRERGPSL